MGQNQADTGAHRGSGTALLLIDFINDLEFPGGDRLLPHAMGAAKHAAALSGRNTQAYTRFTRTTILVSGARISGRSWLIAHVTMCAERLWSERSSGDNGARLLEAQMARTVATPSKGVAAGFLRIVPCAVPSVAEFVAGDDSSPEDDDYFWPYPSERKARNALRRFAATHRLCHLLLGLTEADRRCGGCNEYGQGSDCAAGHARLQHFARLVAAFAPCKVRLWPYAGPIGVHERRDLIVIDRWRFLGTARNEAEAYALLQSRRVVLDSEIYRILIGALPKLQRRSIVELRRMYYCEARPSDVEDCEGDFMNTSAGGGITGRGTAQHQRHQWSLEPKDT